MCGRYTNTGTSTRLLAERFAVGEEQIDPETLGRFNVCPTEKVLAVTGEPRTPFLYRVDGGAPFAFAGLWDPGRGEASACVLTTAANGVCRPVHDRMPCILGGPEEEAAWLSGDVDSTAAVELLRPLDDARVTAAPANPAVNKAGVEGAELLVAPEPGTGAGAPETLFS